ncbi:YceI family protein [Elizabethkingia sp. JS20170427COW]|uniref:YceI family protein n=1 Tax=Elizabethkingia sp. JS20170427COW TaxID=2583851 RepID=UPI0011105509|nr:YceI family protein [Elizabethkingia sp. JS20170427COW]QCX52536.1 YceI family protein [Elizabethkingia sp. JS20170427COW]
MKKRVLLGFALGIVGSSLIISCSKDKPLNSETTEVATTKDGKIYDVDTVNSKLEWTGYKILKSDNTSQFGSLKFESGQVTIKDGILESGNFVANMNSISSESISNDPESKAKLDSHLKDGDFFETNKFPTATFEITKVTPNTIGDYNTIIDGNLTIKGVTKPFSINANVKVDADSATIKSEKKDFNRKDFGINFTAPISNGVIKDEISLQINIKVLENK